MADRPDMPREDRSFVPKPVLRRGERRRAAVLEAAAALFLEKGYEGASLSDIVARAGGSRRLIYDQFGSKEGLFEEMMVRRCAEVLEALEPADVARLPPRVALKNLGERFQQVMMSEAVQSFRRMVFSEGARFPRISEIFFRAGHDATIEHVSRYFAEIDPCHGLYFEDPFMIAVMFLSMIQGDAIERLTARAPDLRSDAMLARQIDMAIDLVLASGTSGRPNAPPDRSSDRPLA